MLSIIYHEPDFISPNGFFTAERNGFQIVGPVDTGPEALEAAYYPYAWPGGYPVGWLAEDNATLCAECALREVKEYGSDPRPMLLEEPSEEGVMCEQCNGWVDPPYVEEQPEPVEDPTDMTIAEYVNSDEDFEVIAFRLPGGA